ncbi:hypothetical protein VTI28DRAFT_7896 [Corynascus sepedonium]
MSCVGQIRRCGVFWGFLWGLLFLHWFCAFRFCCIIVHGLGKWGQVWYGFASVQWEDHRSRKPNICTVGWSMWRALLLRVSLTPLTDYLILPSQRIFLFPFLSFSLSFLRFDSDTLFDILFVSSFLASLSCFLFCLQVVCPICSTSCTRYGQNLGREVLGRNGTREEWAGGWDCCWVGWVSFGSSLDLVILAQR